MGDTKESADFTDPNAEAGEDGVRFKGALAVLVKEKFKEFQKIIPVDGRQCRSEVTRLKCSSRLPRNKSRKKEDEATLNLELLLPRRVKTPVDWVRADPDGLWIRPIQVTQHEVMWIYQLLYSKNVVSQLDAVEGLRKIENPDPLLAPKALDQTLLDPKYYYQVRIAAAEAAASLASGGRLEKAESSSNKRQRISRDETDASITGEWKVEQHSAPFVAFRSLYEFLKNRYYDQANTLWKANDFKDLPEYFLKRGVITALSRIKDIQGLTDTRVVTMIKQLLQKNDNTGNAYSDSHYLADLIRCLGRIRLSETEDRDEIRNQIARYLK
eukprot:jgi/Bigna1/140783/aug1.58_g15491